MDRRKPQAKVKLVKRKRPLPKDPVVSEMTDAEVKELARDLVKNQIFMTDQLRDPSEVKMVFPILSFLDRSQMMQLKRRGVVHLYERNDKMLPRGINGHPMFMSMRSINSVDYARVREEERRMRKALGEDVGEPA